MATKKKKAAKPKAAAPAARRAASKAAQPQALAVAPQAKKAGRGKAALFALVMLGVIVGLGVEVTMMARHQASLKFDAIHVGKVIPQGMDDGQARSPQGLQGDKDDNLFFLEGQGDQPARLQKFDSMGNFLKKYVPKKVDELIDGAVDLDVDQDGGPWVLLNKGQIRILSPDLKYLRSIAVPVGGPSAIGLGPDGRVFVASQSDNKIVIFDASGKKLGEFGAQGTNSGDVTNPVRMRVTVDGLIAVLEQTPTGLHCKVFGPDLKLKTQFDIKNVPWCDPLHIGVTVDDKLMLNDQLGNRGLLVWDLKSGDFVGESTGCTDNSLFISPGGGGANKFSKAMYIHSINGLTHCLMPQGKRP
jgi:hypothetical protein